MRIIALLAVLAAPAAAQDVVFQSPSGNIGCIMFGDGGARCDIGEANVTYRNGGGCDLDYGTAFYVGPIGSGEVLCAGDTARDPSAPVLDYGYVYEHGGVICESQPHGMACTNAGGGGFIVRRADQQVF